MVCWPLLKVYLSVVSLSKLLMSVMTPVFASIPNTPAGEIAWNSATGHKNDDTM